MTASDFLKAVPRGHLAPVYLFLGPENYERDLCRRELVDQFLGPQGRDAGYVRHDLGEMTLAAVFDDARSLSLFAPRRVLWVDSAHQEGGTAEQLAAYLRNPSPGVVIVFDCSRFDLVGEDKAKAERVRKFFSAAGPAVEFPRWKPAQARKLAADLANRAGLKIGSEELDLLVESVGASPTRMALEMEKLCLRARDEEVSAEMIGELVPEAQTATIFALVAALGRNDRRKALDLLETLVREGEYLPLALSFLGSQFRQALVVQEAGLTSPFQVQRYFSDMGVPMWPARAEQVTQTAASFSPVQLRKALRNVATADDTMKNIRPDDRIIMERLVLNLTR